MVAVCCTVIVTSAGACNPARPDEPVPPPDELATSSFPEASTRQGIDALYVGRERFECDELLLLTPDGSAHHFGTCGDIEAYVADPAIWTDETNGDYAYRGDMLWVRTVAWQPIIRDYELTERVFRYCDGGLRSIPPDSFTSPFEYRLVEGDGPPDAAPCPA